MFVWIIILENDRIDISEGNDGAMHQKMWYLSLLAFFRWF